MSTGCFSHYARYYDLLYREKNYVQEARFVDHVLRSAGANPGALLDVGCGTGAHARQFAALGWTVAGVDLSPTMIERARQNLAADARIEFFVGAAADFDLGRPFDAAVSLFHVASYQTGENELARMIENIGRHLKPGGVFIFDFWHGPGVLADPPTRRNRQLEDDGLRVSRTAEPTHRPESCLVEVKYEIVIEDIPTAQTERIVEVHRMRYFFLPELRAILSRAGFAVERVHGGFSEDNLAEQAWYGLIVARKES
jgi:SAM-dependent methyltransferase